ncbi:uncharacterized protein LOC131425782 [Malaya genurostris]|uniref:uncharacterized protein LOC131425782 n=1 Tax=Malaya genurostris TaxID=325434 RepID=UPI0026F3E119|nr:uncharacterized protein LOC131425782 [Malaya genurostris]
MDWSALPLEPLESILGKLKFKDRLACSLVCRRWNEALFSCPALAQTIVLVIGTSYGDEHEPEVLLRYSKRNYRLLAVELNNNVSSAKINRCLVNVLDQCEVHGLSLFGMVNSVFESIRLHSVRFRSLTELSLELTVDQLVLLSSVQELTMEQLKKFHYIQLYSGSAPASVAVFLDAPNLESAVIVLESLGDEEALYREGPLLELRGCSRLKTLEVDLKGCMWQNFFTTMRPKLERLLIRRASDESEEYDWDMLFGNMPALHHVDMVYSNDAMLSSLSRNCSKLKKLVLNGFRYEDGSFGDNINRILLEELHVDGRLRSVLYSNQSTLTLKTVKKISWSNVKFSRVQYVFVVDAPEVTSVTVRWCDYRRFQLRPGDQLKSIDIDYYGNQTVAPNFFRASLDQLHSLILYINGSSLALVGQMDSFPCLKKLELICSTEHHGYGISALFESICVSCLGLVELTIRNEHERLLHIENCHLIHLVRLEHLRVLTLQYITIINVSDDITLGYWVRINAKGCRIVDCAGQQTKFPIRCLTAE